MKTAKEAYYEKRGAIGYGDTVENYVKHLEKLLVDIYNEDVLLPYEHSYYINCIRDIM